MSMISTPKFIIKKVTDNDRGVEYTKESDGQEEEYKVIRMNSVVNVQSAMKADVPDLR